MASPRARFWGITALFLSVNVAGLAWIGHAVTARGADRVRVLSALPIRDVDTTDRLTFVFDSPLAGRNDVGRQLAEPPFTLEPAPAGRWTWAADDRLEFVLDRPLPAGRVFAVRPAAHFERLTGRTLVGEQEFRFSTRPLRLEACELDSADRLHGNIVLRFNQPVHPADLVSRLRMTSSAGAAGSEHTPRVPTEFECLTRTAAEEIVLRVPRPEDSAQLEVSIDGDLAGYGAELPLGEAIVRRVEFVPHFSVERANVRTPRLGSSIEVALNFSRRLDEDQAVGGLRIDPPVDDLRTDIWWDELTLSGAFVPGMRYSATVGPTLVANDGKTLGEEQSVSFRIPDWQPALHIPAWRGVLSPKGNLLLDLETVNVTGVRVAASRLFANNLVPHLRGDGPRETSSAVGERTIALTSERNVPATVALDLREIVGQQSGIYSIAVDATDHHWTSDRAIVTVTDLAITSKQHRDGLWIWVTSLSTAEPVADAEVQAITYANQVVASAITDSNGIASLSVPAGHPDGMPWVVVARHGGDLAYLQPGERPWVLDDVDQSGRRVPDTYDVMMYTERGVYRPGDTVHVTGIVRDATGAVPPSFPLAVQVHRPDGRRVAEFTVAPETGAHGVFHIDYASPEDGQLGRYRFSVSLPGSTEVLGQADALVEAFLPVRIELRAHATQARYRHGQSPEVSVKADYLFGKPAADLPVAVTGHYRLIPFESERFPGFTFGVQPANGYQFIEETAAALDAAGTAGITVPAPERASQLPGLHEGRLSVTVSETGGRSVSTNLTVLVDNADRHIGLRCAYGNVAPAGYPVAIEWVQVNGADEPLETPEAFEVTAGRVEYDWVIEEVNDHRVWKTVERLIPIHRELVNGASDRAAQGLVQFTCPRPGLHRITTVGQDSSTTSVLEFQATSDLAEIESQVLKKPELLEFVLDQERYRPGSTALATVRAPFSGTLLVTLETDRVLWHRLVEMDGKSAAIEVPVPATLRGGAFLTGTLIRALDRDGSEWLPQRAMGMVRLPTDHADHEIAVAIDAPDKAEPGETVAVNVRTDLAMTSNGAGLIHLWAVDDGILLTTGYGAPDPAGHFFADRAAIVETADVFFDLLPDYRRPVGMEHIGADGDEDDTMELRRSPVEARHRAPAVVWSTALPVDSNGCLTTEMVMPELMGRVRFMAVAVGGDRYGRAHRTMELSRPLILEASPPRFVSVGDRFEIPVKLFLSDAASTGVMELTNEADGPIEVRPVGAHDRIELEAGKAEVVWLSAEATGIGHAAVRLQVRPLIPNEAGPTAACTFEIPVRTDAPLHSEMEFLQLQAGESTTLSHRSNFLANTARTRIQVSARPEIELLPAAEALLDYPYGCVEQTTSRLIALLGGRELLARELPDDGRASHVEDMIQAGIARLWSMQTRSGGLAYWPGSQAADPWGSAYAAGFLIEAKEAGYAVNAEFLGGLRKYLGEILPRDGQDAADPNTKALICRVLAESDEPPLGWMAHLSEQPDVLDLAGRAHLAVAWHAAGRKDRALELLDEDLLQGQVIASTGGRITSAIRQQAVLLDALCRLAPDHASIVHLARRVKEARTNGSWGNTLENATAFAALVRYQAVDHQAASFEGSIRAGADEVLVFDHVTPASCTVATGEPITISSAGSGVVYLAVTTEGLLDAPAIEPYDRGLSVRRHWLRADGKPAVLEELQVGDLVKSVVTWSAPSLDGDARLQNVVIVDALPGGVEVENPRLLTSADPVRFCATQPDRVEFRDDRALIFTSVGRKPQTYEHNLRVVSVGSFRMPAIQASNMYDNALASLHGGGRIETRP